LDVKNAFNTASWEKIMQCLTRMNIDRYLVRIVGSYLNDRVLQYATSDGNKSQKVTGGVPQGLVLGPTLWNLMYDWILRITLPPGVKIVGFADDIAIVAVQEWLVSAGLSLAEQKTEAVLISSRKKVETATLTVGNTTIT
ncbi:hypothetical protein KR018_011937, partial [Drosophila ironensis]